MEDLQRLTIGRRYLMSYVIVSAFTQNTPYEQEVIKLKNSFKKFNIPNKIYPYINQGTWEKNCQMKAKFILQALNEQDKDVVWVDADAEILKQPVYFENLECDLSVYHLKSRWNPYELCSGTVFYKNNVIVKEVVGKWIELNKTNSAWDQKNLQHVVEVDYKKRLKVLDLPVEYIKIERNRYHVDVKDPVILHYQASRRCKRVINGKR